MLIEELIKMGKFWFCRKLPQSASTVISARREQINYCDNNQSDAERSH